MTWMTTLAQDSLATRRAVEMLRSIQEESTKSTDQIDEVIRVLEPSVVPGATRLEIFHGYVGVFIVAFLVTLLVTPLMRRLAIANGVIDRPGEARKVHRIPIAYMGGVAVYLGLLGAILFSYTAKWHGLIAPHPTKGIASEGLIPGGVPVSILLGMTVIMIVGLLDDVLKISPRIKIAGQLVAAAALAVENVGVKLASQVVVPVANAFGIPTQSVGDGIPSVVFSIPMPVPVLGIDHIPIDVVYWVGTAIIALAVLGACNASNLIDGLDGLLTGTTAISAVGLLVIALSLALADDGARQVNGGLDGPRIVLCLALLGACLGFLPHNFNPATIFLGDAGSLLLGYCTIVIILTLGDTGRTNLVLAGLVVYALPIIDTTLAIVRRKVSGKAISAADDQHLHHMLKRALGVKSAVFVLYLIAASFAVLGVSLALFRSRLTYAVVLVFAAYIGVTAFKIARRKHIEEHAERRAKRTGQGPAVVKQDEAGAPALRGVAESQPVGAAESR
ncbi:MAG: undecaprenyl/decaprenyl-phosphate alpha-N-acetylglucosaminyl 1-phosphate transferase [Phycisphaeraceae bacterium]|nr:undecaprenyl/decaprenyl-phosphate alpha-N-acetylglucosaminyl 1-phosphate transferase [Phycisphaeraceae bacterium]